MAPCLIACPAGDSAFVVILRDGGFVPWDGEKVILDFSNCPGFRLDPPSGNDPYNTDPTGRRISMYTDRNGTAAFPVRGGGGCGGGEVTVIDHCNGTDIWYGVRKVASPDQNGDLVVDNSDVAVVQAKVGAPDASADFDCDGAVTSSDVDIARAHVGHSAAGPLSVGTSSASGLYLVAYPNPAKGHLTVSFSLPSAAHAALELIDLSGRRIQRDELGSLTPGLYTLPLPLQTHLRPGLYFLKLDHESRHLLAKVCILH